MPRENCECNDKRELAKGQSRRAERRRRAVRARARARQPAKTYPRTPTTNRNPTTFALSINSQQTFNQLWRAPLAYGSRLAVRGFY